MQETNLLEVTIQYSWRKMETGQFNSVQGDYLIKCYLIQVQLWVSS